MVQVALMCRAHGMLRPIQLQSPSQTPCRDKQAIQCPGQHRSSCDKHRTTKTSLLQPHFQTGWDNSQHIFHVLHKDYEPSQEYQVTSEERGPLTAHSCAASKVQCPPQDPAVLPVQRCPLHAYSATAHVSNLAGQLSHCSVIVKRHHGQGNLRNLQKCLIGSLLIVFRGESRTITVGSIAAGRCWGSSS